MQPLRAYSGTFRIGCKSEELTEQRLLGSIQETAEGVRALGRYA